eukprot:m.445813 g.445813  ORF g.445813 m.445813 type:complete len:230 (-) comp19280_c0_seq1:24-713(-)
MLRQCCWVARSLPRHVCTVGGSPQHRLPARTFSQSVPTQLCLEQRSPPVRAGLGQPAVRSLSTQISQAPDLKSELKATMLQTRSKDLSDEERADAKAKLTIIKGIMSGVKNAEIAESAKASTTDPAALQIQVVQSMIKKGTQAAEEYKGAGRTDLAEKELKEVRWLQDYLPPQLSSDELKAIATQLVTDMNATSMKHMGRVIGAMREKVGAGAPGGDISAAVKEALGTL